MTVYFLSHSKRLYLGFTIAMHKIIRVRLLISIIFGLLFSGHSAVSQTLISPPYMQKEWSEPYKPFHIAGNLYYVGTFDLACYLIATSKGHILINTGLPESMPMIKSNIEALGFKFSDIKILLATHAHYDHVGAMADVKKMTGAAMMIHEDDAAVLNDGGNSDYAFGGKGITFKPVKADRLLRDKDTLRIDDMEILVLHHPGHTKGANSFLFNVKDESRNYRILIANMPTVLDETNLSGMASYPDVGKDYAYTFEALKKLQFDIWLSSHANQFRMHTKHKSGDSYNPTAFIDRTGYDETIAALEKIYLRRLTQ
jgi:metallo-beta-lactamase class B